MKALVVGGTGPTGPLIVQGLLDRGFDVTIYHRGEHEAPDLPPVQGHLHGDPNSLEDLQRDIGGPAWDLVCSMYGRLRLVADVCAGKCGRFIGIGSMTGNVPPELLPFPEGRAVPVDERAPRLAERLSGYERQWAIADSERQVMEHHAKGDFAATMFRYTGVYGPRARGQWLWPVVRRVMDRRPRIIVPGEGTAVSPICFTRNAAQQVLLAVDHAGSAGEAFNSVDRKMFYLRDLLQIIAGELGHRWEVVQVHHPLAARLATGYARPNRPVDTTKLACILGYDDVVRQDAAVRETVRWLWDRRDELVKDGSSNSYAYDLEDRLMESCKRWTEEARKLDAS